MSKRKNNVEPGTIKIRGALLGSIARIAALQTQGVAGMKSRAWARFLAGLSNVGVVRERPLQIINEGVRVRFGENEIKIIICVLTEYGANIPNVVGLIQDNVKRAIEEMTGIASLDVVVDVRGVTPPKTGG